MNAKIKTGNNNRKLAISVFIALIGMGADAHAAIADAMHDWQQNILTNPSQRQIAREKAGQVTIFDGLTDKIVNSIMDNQFNRLDSMMFTHIIITGDDGTPLKDKETGELLTEDDGC
jgi:hypothetical protein